VGKLPKRLLESNRWLDDFCHFDFEHNSPREWAATWFPNFNITGYTSLFEHLRHLVLHIHSWPPEGATSATEPETAAENKKATPTASIPAKYRTIPMSYRQAARHLGKQDSQDSAEWVSSAVAGGSICCEHITRQNHVFDIRQFPWNAWPTIRPTDGKTP
jgi:hypothetical protein